MNRPDLDVRIETLVLHGVSRTDAERIARATQTHLARLLAEPGIQVPEAPAAAEGRGSAPTLEAEYSPNPARFGNRIASAVQKALGGRAS